MCGNTCMDIHSVGPGQTTKATLQSCNSATNENTQQIQQHIPL